MPGLSNARGSAEALPLPALNSWLRLVPDQYEQEFRTSTRFRTFCKQLDLWSLWATLLVNGMFLMWHGQLGDFQASLRTFLLLFFPLTGIAQHAFAWWHPECYFQQRSSFIFFNRATRLISFCTSPLTLRQVIHLPPAQHALLQAVAPPTLPFHPPGRLLTLAKRTAFLSGSVTALIHGINTPLPLGPQLLLHLLYITILLILQQAPTVHLLQHAAPPSEFRELCLLLNSGVAVLAETVLLNPPTTPDRLDSSCHQQPVSVLVQFFTIFVALVLPGYVAYRVEYHAKAAFVREHAMAGAAGGWDEVAEQEARQGTLPPGRFDIVLLMFVAANVWLVVVRYSSWISLLAYPL